MVTARLIDLYTVSNNASPQHYVALAKCHYALMKSYLELLQGVEQLKADRWATLKSEVRNI